MTTNFANWLWFSFFFGGAVGGWVLIALCGAEVVSMMRRARTWRDEV